MIIEKIKSCKECMYFQQKKFCIRRNKDVEMDAVCLHFVREMDRHSLEQLIDSIVDAFI